MAAACAASVYNKRGDDDKWDIFHISHTMYTNQEVVCEFFFLRHININANQRIILHS